MPVICVLFFAFMINLSLGTASLSRGVPRLSKLLEMNVVAKIFLLLTACSTAYTVNH